MRRIVVLLTLAAVVGSISWGINVHLRQGRRISELTTRLASANDRAAALEQDLREVQPFVTEARRKAEQLQARLERARRRLEGALDPPHAPIPTRARGGAPLSLFVSELAPNDARVVKLSALREEKPIPQQAIVLWARGDPDYSDDMGLLVWQPRRVVPESRSHQALRLWWRVVYSIHLEEGRVSYGMPGQEEEERSYAIRLGFAAGDLTRDGHPEILSFEATGGSGGCGVYMVLDTAREQVMQLLRRETCETTIDIVSGMLRVDAATYPPGCESIHGCGQRRTFLRWDGTDWRFVRSRILVEW